jgi:hypothetical protein
MSATMTTAGRRHAYRLFDGLEMPARRPVTRLQRPRSSVLGQYAICRIDGSPRHLSIAGNKE